MNRAWPTAAKRVGLAAALIAAAAAVTFALYHVARFLHQASAEERTWTGITIVFLAGVVLAWHTVVRGAELMRAAETIQAHSETAAHRATQASDRAGQMLDVLGEWWDAHTDEDPDPVTEPMPRPVPGKRTDTAHAPAVQDFAPTPRLKLHDPREIGYEHDPDVAEVIAHADNELIDARLRWADDMAGTETSDRRQA